MQALCGYDLVPQFEQARRFGVSIVQSALRIRLLDFDRRLFGTAILLSLKFKNVESNHTV